MSSRPNYISTSGVTIKVSEVLPPIVYRVASHVYKIVRQDEEYNLDNHYVEVFVNGNYIKDTQNEVIDLRGFHTEEILELKLIAKRWIHEHWEYSNDIVHIFDYNFVAGDHVLVGDELYATSI